VNAYKVWTVLFSDTSMSEIKIVQNFKLQVIVELLFIINCLTI